MRSIRMYLLRFLFWGEDVLILMLIIILKIKIIKYRLSLKHMMDPKPQSVQIVFALTVQSFCATVFAPWWVW